MAGLTLLDLMLADAITGVLATEHAREQARRERPPPDNVSVIPKELCAWNQIKEDLRKENKVFLMDITDETSENCKRVDGVFFDMARDFNGLPFFLVKVGPFETFDQLRQDLGGIQCTPTILIGFYGEKLKRVKYEGEEEIQNGLNTGHLKAQVQELMEMRGKLKLVEHVEREEKVLKEAEDKKRQEEEEQKKQYEKIKTSAEIRRESRPQHLEELLKMDLDTASIKDMKAIMIKMGISFYGCLERGDLKKKLLEGVPELRIATERKGSISSRGSASGPCAYLQKLVKQYGLTDKQLNSEIGYSDIPFLAEYFNGVTIYLSSMEGLTPAEQADVNQCYHMRGTQEAMIKCLTLWKSHDPFAATYKALLELLLRLRQEETACQICQHLIQIYVRGVAMQD